MVGWPDVWAIACPWRRHDGYFVDLYVRKSNAVAIGMYEKVRKRGRAHVAARDGMHGARSWRLPLEPDLLPCALQFGYVVYRQVIKYYNGEEDAYGACASCV